MSDWNNFLPTREQLESTVSDPNFWKKRGYVKVANEGERYKVKAHTGVDVVYGAYHEGKNKYVQKKHNGKMSFEDVEIMCNNPTFDKDPAPKVKKACYAKIVKDLRGSVDVSNNDSNESNESNDSNVNDVNESTSNKGKYIVIGASVLALALITVVIVKTRKK